MSSVRQAHALAYRTGNRRIRPGSNRSPLIPVALRCTTGRQCISPSRPACLLSPLAPSCARAPRCGGKSGSGAVEYSVSAQKNYDKGLKQLERKDWVAASKYFGFIKSRFPYSKYAVLAELRLADAEFGAEQYLEAIDSYRLFIKFHPTHEMVANGYAHVPDRRGVLQAAARRLLAVPAVVREGPVLDRGRGERAQELPRQVPGLAVPRQGQGDLVKVGKRLADHEWYVARYYWDRGKPMGTVLRLRRCSSATAASATTRRRCGCLGRAYVDGRHAGSRAHDLAGARQQVSRSTRARRRRPRPRSPSLAAASPLEARDAVYVDEHDRVEQLITLGREHYNARRVRARRSRSSPRRVRAARASPTSTTCSASSITRRAGSATPRRPSRARSRLNPRYTEAALNLGGDLQRSRQVRRGARGLHAGRRGARRPAATRSIRSRAASSPTCTPTSAPPTPASRCSTRPCASTTRRSTCAPTSPTCASGSATSIATWACSTPRSREFEQAKQLRPDYLPARIHLGVTLFSLGRKDEASPSGRTC